MRFLFVILLAGRVFCQQPAPTQPPPKPGVKTPGVQIPFASLKPDFEFPVPGAPDWIAVGESVWISNAPKDNVTRIDPKTNKIVDTITGFHKPCGAWRSASAACGFRTAATGRWLVSI